MSRRAPRLAETHGFQCSFSSSARYAGGMSRPPLEKPPKFVWPPGPVADAPPPPEFLDPRPRTPSWLHLFEVEFLGQTDAPFANRAAEDGWMPDTRADYCPRCGSDVREHEPLLAADDRVRCSWCASRRLPWDSFVRLGRYDRVLRDAILDLKFTAWRTVGRDLGRLLGEAMAAELARAKIPPQRVLLVPVPTSWRRRVSRGVDHTLVLARGIATAVPVRIGRPIGRRHRPAQVSLSGPAREKNAAGAFYPRSNRLPDIQLVVVMDDVRTTGATLRAACRATRLWLRQKGARPGAGGIRVWAAAVGVTPEASREPEGPGARKA